MPPSYFSGFLNFSHTQLLTIYPLSAIYKVLKEKNEIVGGANILLVDEAVVDMSKDSKLDFPLYRKPIASFHLISVIVVLCNPN
jgi:hypothetical protein